MTLDFSHPAVADLRRTAKRRLPKFAFEYLDSATGNELGLGYNRTALDAVRFMPRILQGRITADLRCKFLGQEHRLPLGIAPVGMSGMIWPGAEQIFAEIAAEQHIPMGLSTVAAAAPEEIGPIAGDMGWFQLYAPKDPEVRRDMLKRIWQTGFKKLVLTADVPADSRRERQRRAHVAMPPRLTPAMVLSMILHPRWSVTMAIAGAPRMKFPESYVDPEARRKDPFVHAGRVIRGWPDWDYLAALRDEWSGDLIVKGVLDPDDATKLVDAGVDAIWVSNHTGRQFEPAPASIEQLPKIRAAVGTEVPLIFDSGIEGGLDVMRALALGADFVFLGRAFHYAVAAFGAKGVRHLLHILEADMQANMAQLGAENLDQIAARLLPASRAKLQSGSGQD